MNSVQVLTDLGQSIWLDYVSRSLITSGRLQSLLEIGVRGMTSNPTIFEKAIAGSEDYDETIVQLAQSGKSTNEIYSALTITDIQDAADQLRPIYDKSNGGDGYISLEVNPRLAHDSASTITEAEQIWALVDRPNLMIKIPATKEGLGAITQTIAAGINVNVTLIFSIDRYSGVLDAYISGLEKRLTSGHSIVRIASVASFFISRLDSKVDAQLADLADKDPTKALLAKELQGRAAVANARLAYSHFLNTIKNERYSALQSRGALLQRPLWASTSTKNPSYPDIKYVQELIIPDTVNTLPPSTLEAFLDHGRPEISFDNDVSAEIQVIESLRDLGIDMKSVTRELEQEGVAAFANSFESLIKSIDSKRADILS